MDNPVLLAPLGKMEKTREGEGRLILQKTLIFSATSVPLFIKLLHCHDIVTELSHTAFVH